VDTSPPSKHGAASKDLRVPHRVTITWADVRTFILATFTLVGIFALIGRGVTKWSWLQETDRQLMDDVVESRTATMNTLTKYGSLLAETWVKIAVTLLVIVVMYALWRRSYEALFVALTLIYEALVFILVTWIVERPRPDVVRLEGSPVDSSFPSGHTAAAFAYLAIALAFGWHSRRQWTRALGVVIVLVVVGIVGYSRFYRGMHYLVDVTAGAALGAISVAVMLWFVRRIGDRSLATQGAPNGIS